MPAPPRVPLPAPHLIVSELDELASASDDGEVCDVCGEKIAGNPGGRGLLMWKRGEEIRFEEPALCRRCAKAITAAGHAMWDEDDGADG
jgi:hypothetical protein